MMYLARRNLDDDTVWLHLINDHELFPARSIDCAGIQVRRTPFAWDWCCLEGRGISAIGETEDEAQALLEERERLVAEVDAGP